jgi:hypothetical protein
LLWLVMILSIGTVWAALWEIFGNKLSTSEQEIRFSCGIRLLMERLQSYCFDNSPSAEKDPKVEKQIIVDFLNVTSKTLCGPKKVSAGLMQREKEKENEYLAMKHQSYRANYDDKFTLPLFDDNKKSAAALAMNWNLVYVPFKRWKEAWVFKHEKGSTYNFPEKPELAWLEALNPKKEKFLSVLCVPVGTYGTNKKWEASGVINVSVC